MFNSIPQREYRIPQRSIRQTNRVTNDFNARARGIANKTRVSEDLRNIFRIRKADILIPQKGYRIPQERKNDL